MSRLGTPRTLYGTGVEGGAALWRRLSRELLPEGPPGSVRAFGRETEAVGGYTVCPFSGSVGACLGTARCCVPVCLSVHLCLRAGLLWVRVPASRGQKANDLHHLGVFNVGHVASFGFALIHWGQMPRFVACVALLAPGPAFLLPSLPGG